MTQQTKDQIWQLVKIGLVGTAVSIPVGIWAMNKWPEKTIYTAIVLTAVGLGVKEYMLHGGSEESTVALET